MIVLSVPVADLATAVEMDRLFDCPLFFLTALAQEGDAIYQKGFLLEGNCCHRIDGSAELKTRLVPARKKKTTFVLDPLATRIVAGGLILFFVWCSMIVFGFGRLASAGGGSSFGGQRDKKTGRLAKGVKSESLHF